MSLTDIELHQLRRQAKLLQFAKTKRIEIDFNDIIVEAGDESIPANRLVLACYSKFFESMFNTSLKERYQNVVEIKEHDGKAIKAIIEQIYTGEINVNADNVMTLLGTADFLQVDDVKKVCFDFLETSLTTNSCLDLVKASVLYIYPSSLSRAYQFISENFEQLLQADSFKDLSKDDLVSLLTNLDRKIVQETLLYTAIIVWVRHCKTRKAEFTSLFLTLDLQKLTSDFVLNIIAAEPLIKESNICFNIVLSYLAVQAKEAKKQTKYSKILCVGGNKCNSVVEIQLPTLYPDLPHVLSNHCLQKLDNFIYCVGGAVESYRYNSTNKVYRLDLNVANSRWEEIASMNEPRCEFGAATWNGNLVVAGGYNGFEKLITTELYEPYNNKWRNIASMNLIREGHVLVVAGNKLFAIGGSKEFGDASASVEQLENLDEDWKEINSMNTPRSFLTAVTCNNFVYAIGGWCHNKSLKTVEKYNNESKQWSFVKSMHFERRRHSACVFDGKIFVVGGKDANDRVVKTIECYDPTTDEWTVIDQLKNGISDHDLVAV